MLKYAFFLSFFCVSAAFAEDYNNLLDHYTKSGAIPQKEAQNIVIKNVYFAGQEKTFRQHRSIASKIQHGHIVKIVNRPLEIRAQ